MKLNRFLLLYLLLSMFTSHRVTSLEDPAPPYFIHNSGNTGGMFAEFASVLGALKSFEQGKFAGLHINFIDGCYLEPAFGPNWWEYYFEPIRIGNTNAEKQECSLEKYINLAHSGFGMDRHEANSLINRYIHLKPEIENEIKTFIKKKFKDHFVIGLHFRGTDKIQEHPRVSYRETYHHLKDLIDNLSHEQKKKLKIYVATDEQQFLEYLQNKLPNKLIYNDFVRSPDTTTPLHYANNFFSNNYQKGREGLVDCLLLSRCHILLRPNGSCFSWASTLFNPNLINYGY